MFESLFEKRLDGKTIAILATDGFEESELFKPKEALEKAGAEVEVISLKGETIRAWNKNTWGRAIQVDREVANADVHDYDALVIPGGVMSPDRLRIDDDVISFVKHFANAGKPIGAICHGPWVLIETSILEGRLITSWPSLKTDLINAGARWVDREVVADNGLITSRKPSDLPAFCERLIQEIEDDHHTPVRKESPTFLSEGTVVS